ncbi:hypothetical protein [Piscibacillus halophilus]|nr:hypothetical protein [Piscibacillus halophilus]
MWVSSALQHGCCVISRTSLSLRTEVRFGEVEAMPAESEAF